MQLADSLKTLIRDIPDFPKPGIVFKDITPLLEEPKIVREVVMALAKCYEGRKVDAVAAIEARGFLFGFLLAQELNVPFVPIRKEGKLPYKKIRQEYSLEYGTATIEMHEDALKKDWQVVIHDDLLATGGTANAAGQLVQKLGARVLGFSFIVHLEFLDGRQLLEREYHCRADSLIAY
ncbi:MAG TPA: adenine phosphoribosyltransferase [Cyclobacteriaceae bacterium]|nr:adenine phosphoribosyltransferase [Cyclobacteriaceae bacterium]HRK53075.1 adenine phosphoribosyltransferase [Cyclobacteriaceae bacterium]